MIRVWSEDLAFDELGKPSTVRFLAGRGLLPHVAVRPGELAEPLAAAIRALSAGGVRVGLWPLLDEADGYWASARNVGAFAAFVERVVQWVRANDLAVASFAIDIEPAIGVVREVRERSAWRRIETVFMEARRALSAARLRESVARFSRIQAYLGLRGFETIAAAIPLAVFDHGSVPIADDLPIAAIEAPLLDVVWSVPWDRLSWMTYTSMVAGYLGPFYSLEDARALLYLILKQAAGRDSARTGVSLGVTSTGRLRDEEPYRSAAELGLDVAAARAAGVTDVAVYSLEGILARSEPERWLAALDAPARAPRITWRARAAFHALRGAARLGARILAGGLEQGTGAS